MALHLIVSENLRIPAAGVLSSIAQKRSFQPFQEQDLILTPDLLSSRELTCQLLEQSSLKILLGKNVFSRAEWIQERLNEENPHWKSPPLWLKKWFLKTLLEKQARQKEGLRLFSFSSSLFELFETVRKDFDSDFLRRFLSPIDSRLTDAILQLFELYNRELHAHASLLDEAGQRKALLSRLREQGLAQLHSLKNIYWIGFVALLPELKELIEALQKGAPALEQVLVLQKPRRVDLQDFISPQDLPFSSVYEVPEEQPRALHFSSFRNCFEEAGFILEKIATCVAQGIPADQIALFVPSDGFWRDYFAQELRKMGLCSEETGLLPSIVHRLLVENPDPSLEFLLEKIERQLCAELARFENAPTEHHSSQIRALHHFGESLQEVWFYRTLFPELPITARLLREILQNSPLSSPPSRPAGIALRTIGQPGIATYRYAFAFGLSQTVYPQLPDRFLGLPLPQAHKKLSHQRACFQHLLGCAKEVFLSCSQTNAQGEKENASPFIQEFIDSSLDQSSALLPQKSSPFFLSEACSDDLSRRLAAEKERRRALRAESGFLGRIREPALLQKLKDWADAHVYSPAQFEEYARCPFKFFASVFLKLKKLQQEKKEANPIERGLLIHSFLEIFFKTHRERLIASLQQESLRKPLQQTLQKEFEPVFEEFLKARPWIHEKLADPLKERLLKGAGEILSDFWERMEESPNPYLPTFFELSFGEPQNPFLLEKEGESPLRLRGRIDRIDVSQQEDGFVLFDYKTGTITGLADEILNFKSFQLPLYAMAAGSLLGQAGACGGLEAFKGALILDLKEMKINQGFLPRECLKELKVNPRASAGIAEEAWKDYWPKLKERLFEIHARIASGDFRRLPDPCDPYCDHQTLCRIRDV